MPIQILAPRLANQIAAGEVVERPASVVKELLENSLDAGASRIEIDIEKGGAKCIRVKDNGQGVAKDELTLALSRHATSKISHLDDLEAIMSLGFRGEALASVSSVSRLTFTSKPQDQEQAWQAIAEGRDMQVHIKPCAHPQGTTVEVLDLFFNTPARRRFLKTEKTEFQHIDELIRRLALSYFDISFTLKHNGKIIRQYRPASTPTQQLKRLASICSDSFVKSALHFESADQGLKISGWISDRLSPRTLGDVQYCYINGRIIRDRLVNHAIKQAYARILPAGFFPGFVIYIDCPAEQVDVNVHPSKHEVRFHQARWVHDFIVSTLSVTLNDPEMLMATSQKGETVPSYIPSPVTNASSNESIPTPTYTPKHHYQAPIDEAQVNAYCDFIRPHVVPESQISTLPKSRLTLPLAIVSEYYLLLQASVNKTGSSSPLYLLSLPKADQLLQQTRLFEAWKNGEVIAQPLLLPVRLSLDSQLPSLNAAGEILLQRLGFSVKQKMQKLIVSKVPALLRQGPVAKILPVLLTYLKSFEEALTESEVNDFCALIVRTHAQLQTQDKKWLFSDGCELLQNIEQHCSLETTSGLFFEPDLSLLLQGVCDA
ncbi:DNA mismatch repair protein MutL [Psychromonas sp. CNPT3]|uniref:DNA mismatch repair endonuclease MutL n=1 Tax=Psychromonas sp. CNPT3 TaxID=314282 RepID=UPI00006EA025|nr:DNA mismatch repair endonuclease MutL [Psychromonas sp. CNPT3]AGH80381.1 DNA mismatch repair protein MutL [Psychromonas sp. CNPT3]